MPLTVETGVGLPDANSFVSLADAAGWMALLGVDEWSYLSEAEQTAHLARGALHVSDAAVYRYSGTIVHAQQALAFPRRGCRHAGGGPDIPEDTVPRQVVLANTTAALHSVRGQLPSGPGLARAPAGVGDVQTKTLDGVGSMTYFDPQRSSATPAGATGPTAALAAYGLPAVTGLVASLLDEMAYIASDGSGRRVAPMVGPSRAVSGPNAFWIGQHDVHGNHLSDTQLLAAAMRGLP